MKKHLLGTTALVAAGMFAMVDPAAAQTKVPPIQVSVGGYFAEYISYTDQDPRGNTTAGRSGDLGEFDQWSDKEIHFNGRTVLDNGLTVGFRVELEGNTDTSDQIDESFMFLDGRFGRLELGSINNVQYRMSYKAPEAQTRPWVNEGNIFNVFSQTTTAPTFDSNFGATTSRFFDNDSEKINYYTPRFAGFQLGASYIPDSRQDANSPFSVSAEYSRGWAVAANFVRTFGAFDVAASVGYMQWEGPQTAVGASAPDPDQITAGLQLGFAGFKVGGSYGRIKDGRTAAGGFNGTGTGLVDSEAWEAGIMYTFGPAAVSLNYFQGEDKNGVCSVTTQTCSDAGDDKFSIISLAGKYALGPGVSLEANIWTAEIESPTPDANNDGTGGVVGVVLVF